MSDQTPKRERLRELLALFALEGLEPAEARELAELRAAFPDEGDEATIESWELAAAAVSAAAMTSMETELPALSDALRRKLEADAKRFLAESRRDAQPPADGSGGGRSESSPRADDPATDGGRSSVPVVAWLGWVAAAAAIALLFLRGTDQSVELPSDGPPASELFAQLEASSAAFAIDWSATEDPLAGGASGRVVWDGSQQRGVMRFEGLPPNDASEHQYQLWIFDARRPEATPVDGGVFDVTGDEAFVPIDPKLEVYEPTLFAVTLEPPGGVVVSDRERILLVAAVN